MVAVAEEVVEGKTWVLGEDKAARGLCPCEEVGLGGREGIHDLWREVHMDQEDGAWSPGESEDWRDSLHGSHRDARDVQAAHEVWSCSAGPFSLGEEEVYWQRIHCLLRE